MDFNVKERVAIQTEYGKIIGEGVIVNINEFREPQFKYAVDADFMDEDYIFVGEENLVQLQEEE